ncbi:MAG: c-type cytochrome [Pirellulaceae bacterium]
MFSNRVDQRAVELLRQWMAGMESDRKFVKDWTVADISGHLSELKAGRLFERGEALFSSAGCNNCHRLHKEKAGIGPNLTGVAQRLKPREILSRSFPLDGHRRQVCYDADRHPRRRNRARTHRIGRRRKARAARQ